MPTLLPKSLKTKLGGGSGRGGSPQQAGGSSPQLHVSFKEGTKPKGAQEATTKPSQEELDAELRASPACQRMSSAEREPEQDEDAGLKPSVDSVFARCNSAAAATRAHALDSPSRGSPHADLPSPLPRGVGLGHWVPSPWPPVLEPRLSPPLPLPLCAPNPTGWTTPHQTRGVP